MSASRITSLRATLLATLVLFSALPASANDDASLPAAGQLTLTGSATLSNLVSLWIDAFSERQPAIVITIADPGSAAGLESLLNGTSDAALISTSLSKEQKQRFIDRYNYPPSTTPLALDGVAIFVNTANPLAEISVPQLDAIYSQTRRCGTTPFIRHWSELGVSGDLALKPIKTTGLSDNSGAYYLFRSKALCGGDFRPDYNAVPGPNDVQILISRNRAAIGFASSTLQDPSLRALPVAPRDGETAIAPDAENIRSGRYPFSRNLSIAYNLPPGQEMPPALQALINFAHSVQGQAIAIKAGYVALSQPINPSPNNS